METTESHYYNWFGVLFFIVLYSAIILFIPYYKKMDKNPKGMYLAFVLAFAIEMHGIPFSMYILSWITSKNIPEGIFWGHTLVSSVGNLGMYINIVCVIIALIMIVNGWYNIYKSYWKKDAGKGCLVTTGIYKYIRHPQYTGLLILSLGMLIEWATLPLLILYPVMIIMYTKLAKREEKDMLKEFGDDYKEYMKKTKMFIPFII